MMQRKFDRYYAADARDKRFRLRFTERSKRQKRFWSSRWFGDQESEGACVGFAFAHWLESSPIRQFMNPFGIYRMAQHLDEWHGTNYEGTSVRAGAKLLQSLGFISEYRWAANVDDIVQTILEIGPMVVGTEFYEGMDSENMIDEGKLLGGHAYLLDGVDVTKKKLRVKNSWGRGWMRRGRSSISFSVMDRLLRRQGECLIGIESLPIPT